MKRPEKDTENPPGQVVYDPWPAAHYQHDLYPENVVVTGGKPLPLFQDESRKVSKALSNIAVFNGPVRMKAEYFREQEKDE